jgi:L-ascorbate metabolism protein UlaG (beta-lactamase superfamily)
MTTITRLADSCLIVATDTNRTLIDPGGFAYTWDGIDLDSIGDVSNVLVTHEHADHVNVDFVKWLLDRGTDVTVHCNEATAAMLARADVEALTVPATDTSFEDVTHETLPTGATLPNRSWTIDDVLTHPGDSYQPTTTAPVMALALLAPWGSMTASVEFAKRLQPRQVIPTHDFYLSESGRAWVTSLASGVLAKADIEVVGLEPGQSFTV